MYIALSKLNKKLEKVMPVLTPIGVVLGVLLATWLKPYAFLVPWIFAGMTFAGSLGSSFKDLARVILHPYPLLVCLTVLHVVMPIVALTAGNIIFPGDAYTITGVLLAFTIPTGVISLMWVSIYKGNVALTISLILIDTFLSPFLVPYTLHLLVGAEVVFNTFDLMKGLFWMVVLPSIAGMVLNKWSGGTAKEKLGAPLAPFSKLALGVVVAINSSVVAPYLKQFDRKLLVIFIAVLCMAASAYAIGWLVARLMKWDRGIIVALTFNSGMRNISAGAVLATTYFPAPVAMPVIIGMLFQQILASFYAFLLRSRYGSGSDAQAAKPAAAGERNITA
ncbi:bile acid:sodium symporter family protein [Paenibacillus thalictri]|uniref:Bile acid:sodium symporter family protein n=1 Tax=Paenibacillus thalictri TaxID=2527873 RepID=A0A4V2J4I1_9BACL|nr:bile acid:sodium symporter family protein [Paenibacillus thalictri]TBL79922.1 bile acid:sodium symporter family protein [Paenibacillus thalictri]